VQESVSLELCQQLRDHLVGGCDERCAELDAGAEPKCELFKMCTEACGAAFVVGVMNVLVEAPRVLGDLRDPAFTVEPFVKFALRHMDHLAREQRGCTALQRFVIGTAPDTDCADAFVAHVTANAAAMVFDQHANYVVSNVLKYLGQQQQQQQQQAAASAPGSGTPSQSSSRQSIRTTPAAFGATLGDTKGLRARAWQVLRLTCRGHCDTGKAGDSVQVKFETVTPAVWLALVRAVTAVLLTDLGRAQADISSSHVLEHCLTRLDHGVFAELAPLLAGVMQPHLLRAVMRRPASLHVVKGLVELFASSPAQFAGEATALRVAAQAESLREGDDGESVAGYITKVVKLVHST
jgi:hypothetical protein